MSNDPSLYSQELSRRTFLIAGAAALAATTVDPTEAFAAAASKLPLRTLGRTKLKLTAMCMGGIGLEDSTVLNHALDVGFNTIHTDRGYVGGRSIVAVGETMKTRRKGTILLLKGEPSTIDDSLKILNTTWCEVIMPQTDSPEQAANPQRRADFEKAKGARKARFMGCAIHRDVPRILQAVVDQKYYDMAMIVYNPSSRNTAEKTELDKAITNARKAGMGLIAMKSVRGGTPEEETACVKALLTDARIDVVLKTFKTHQDVDKYREVAGSMAKLPKQTAATEIGEMLAGRACVACGQCGLCPRGIAVADILRFRMYSEEYGWMDYGREQYASLAPHQRANNCQDCDLCVEGCGNRINIPQRLAEAHAILA
ncbi:MAG TPA: hypothetical protein VGN26_21615 [Armatimonadota bacterium]|jgi:predicted aldo/keto reductase-like oxidoreductase